MTFERAIEQAQERARQLRIDPQLTVSEVYEAELLRRLQPKLRGNVVWKGGTVLRLEGSERFSRDLYATRRTASLTPTQLKRILKQTSAGLPYLAGFAAETQPGSVVAVYRFTVPRIGQPIRIRIEISTRETIVRPPTTVSTARIAHPSGIEPVVLSRLDDRELLAEKVRALVMRTTGRDIFDVYWLLERGVEFDPALFLKKMRYYETVKKPVDPATALQRTIRQLKAYNPSRAKTELSNLLPAAQRNLDFSVIVEDIRGTLEAWLPKISG
ncbi:nucleotidyl transferase AbiEii/AbiGii toxin family protein [Acidobacteriia bacterium AH_259_A11_L15]|nr:nucleotidyl transferase AbiEii/AbiGii toxin family protein [Acidobacteriia bacterium AH_259_A11_L15]